MKMLREKRFNTVSLATLAVMREQNKIPPKTVCVTLDDGFMDSYTSAFPVLMKFQIPASIFIETANIGFESKNQGAMFSMMGERELKELHDSGLVSIESHTVHHPRITKISEEEVYHEVWEAKVYIERLLNKTCEHFAYPFGMHNESVRRATFKAGIRHAYTTQEGLVRLGDDTMRLNRNNMNRTISLTQFESICLWGRLSRTRFRQTFS